MVHLVLEVLKFLVVLGVQGFLGALQSHLPPGVLTDPADLGNQYPRPPVTTETNMKAVNHHRIGKTAERLLNMTSVQMQQQNKK